RRDDVEPLGLHPAGIWRLFFSCEFFRQVFRGEGFLGHAFTPSASSSVLGQARPSSAGSSYSRLHSWAACRTELRRTCPPSCAHRSDRRSASAATDGPATAAQHRPP